MRKKELQFAPRDVFEKILEYSVIPTFDLIIWFSDRGVLLGACPTIHPYKKLGS